MTDVPQGPPDLPDHTHLRWLGSGGYADVHLYRQDALDLPVAVKVLRDNAGLTDAQRAQFTVEAHTMARLSGHPNIVPITFVGTAADGRPYLVMKYYSGDTLAAQAAVERFTVADTLRIGVLIADAVDAVHRADILHRDIKPGNILVDDFGQPALTDFGIAGSASAVESDETAGVSVPWSPPDVLYGTDQAGVRSDVYSLGATLWHLLVGRSPFAIVGADADNSNVALMYRIQHASPPSTGRTDVPDTLDRLLRQTMAKVPEHRPNSAAALVTALRGIESELGLTPTVPPATAWRARTVTRPGTGSDAGATRLRPPKTAATGTARKATTPTTARAMVPDYRVVSPTPSPHTAPRSRPADRTVHRAPATPAATEPEPVRPATGRRVGQVVLIAVGLVVLTVVGVTVLSSGGSHAPNVPPSTHDPADEQDAGQAGENVQPGTPTITAIRSGAGTLHFAWTYSAPLANDTFAWRTQGANRSGVVRTPSLDLPDPSGVKLCVQIKVVRADGSNAATDWSPAGCGG
jgi:eukaryotic-like serine/threonine-protein kinase